MSKLSLGDYAVNSESHRQQFAGGLSLEQLKKRSEQSDGSPVTWWEKEAYKK